MSIPSGDKVLGETGHLQDHNDITDVLRDHEERITEVEGASLGIADISGLQAALDAKAPTEAPTLVGPVEITGDIGSTIFSGDDFLMDVASDNPVAGPGMSMTKRREAAAALEVGDAVGYIGYMKGSDSGGDPTLGLQLHVEVDDTVDAGIVPMALVLSQQKADGTFEETHRWNSDGSTTPASGGGGASAGTVGDITGGGTSSDDDDYNYLTFDTPGIYELDVVIDGGDYADVDVFAWGAGGGGTSYVSTLYGGPGAHARGTWRWFANRRLCVVVGSGGLSLAANAGMGTPGYGGGGLPGIYGFAGQGGGYSGVFDGPVPEAADPIVIAAGGGGCGAGTGAHGGQGGTTSGGSGGGDGGTGATQTRAGYPTTNGIAGAIPGGYLCGWSPYGNTDGGGGGGGGGGFFGGGSGANNGTDGGGGGGSSYLHPGLSSSAWEAGSGTGSSATPGGDDQSLYPGSPVGYGGHDTTGGGRGHVVLRWPKAV